MKVSEFAKSIQESFSLFFGGEVAANIGFCGGEFSIEIYLKKQEGWSIREDIVPLCDIRITFTNDYSPKPKVMFIDFFLLGEHSGTLNYTLEETIVYIKEHLATVKSKAIYENL